MRQRTTCVTYDLRHTGFAILLSFAYLPMGIFQMRNMLTSYSKLNGHAAIALSTEGAD